MFSSRIDAGRQLAQELVRRHVRADLVLGIARGGVVVAAEITKYLHFPLDVVVVKKLEAPTNSELAIGALTYKDATYIDENLASTVDADKHFIADEVKKKHHEFLERERLLRNGKPPPVVENKCVLVVDDGVATGATCKATVEWLRKEKVKRIILALPVAPFDSIKELSSLVDEYVILEEPKNFQAVGEFYKDFREVQDEEVITLLS